MSNFATQTKPNQRNFSNLPDVPLTRENADIATKYAPNVTALSRFVPLVFYPTNETQVQAVVAWANACRVSLYPWSTGKNWGLGSKLPVCDECALVDLSGMTRIHEVSDTARYAIIEPGVTQAMLARHLTQHHPGLLLNCTGSFAHTGIVGNVLERGDGIHARIDDLLGVRGILGNGEPFCAGGVWEGYEGRRPSHVQRTVAGPDLAGIFSQSNYGIVTTMAVRLRVRPETQHIFFGSAPEHRLEALIDAFDRLCAQGVISRGGVNVGYANRFVQGAASLGGQEAGPAEEAWNFYASVAGTPRLTDAVLAELDSTFRPLCDSVGSYRVFPQGKAPHVDINELPAFVRPAIAPMAGCPDAQTLAMIYQMTGTPLPDDERDLDVDHTPFGMKCCIPLVPTCGADARLVAKAVSSVRQRWTPNIKVSFYGDGRTLITIHFDRRNKKQIEHAEMAEADLWNQMETLGYPPYRAAIDQMERLVEQRPQFFDLARMLKMSLDPQGIISPGRYCPRT
ncbi:4-cresol dehydrogenase [hydroxylating] flavoprotein subunit [Abditibacteriota bacterium]|nr:4-cresol dehydrogenase [hydroxylating] flavoprotein subunit [Abditibacteriota bacterium]